MGADASQNRRELLDQSILKILQDYLDASGDALVANGETIDVLVSLLANAVTTGWVVIKEKDKTVTDDKFSSYVQSVLKELERRSEDYLKLR